MLAFEQDILGSDFHSPEGAGHLTMWIPDNIGGGRVSKKFGRILENKSFS